MNRRRIIALLPVLALCGVVLSGCGFRPLYGKHSDAPGLAAELATVAVAPMPDRSGQLLRNAIEQRLERAGAGQAKVYTLVIDLVETGGSLGLGKDATSSRSSLALTTTFELRRDGKVLFSGASAYTAAYNMLEEQYATIISERDSRDRAVNQIADDITRRLAVFLGNRPGS
ncbi:MAG: LPS assembly lipoprotein LptE [Rhodospirillaceae bacterium]